MRHATAKGLIFSAVLMTWTAVAAEPLTVRLSYTDDGLPVYAHTERQVDFKRTPDVHGAEVHGHLISMGGGTNEAAALGWVPEHGNLYVDANRNLDLTDDGPPYRRLTENVFGSHLQQDFKGVELRSRSGRRYRGEIIMSTMPYPEVGVRVVSGWQGQFRVNGEDWTLTFSDDLDGSFDGQDALLVQPSSLSLSADLGRAYSVAPAENLFFGGKCYAVDYAFDEAGDLTLTLDEKTVPMGSIRFTGRDLELVTLAARHKWLPDRLDGTAILWGPFREAIPVPAGPYTLQQIALHSPQTKVPFHSTSQSLIAVPEGGVATCAAGGPLVNRVVVTRHGRRMQIQYAPFGGAGEWYAAWGTRDTSPVWQKPGLYVVHESDVVYAGKLEYG